MSFWAQQRKFSQEFSIEIFESLRYAMPFIIILAIIITDIRIIKDIRATEDIKNNRDPYIKILAAITANALYLCFAFLWCVAFWE